MEGIDFSASLSRRKF